MTLPPRDPALCFGEEALSDMKSLRRAYARLLRTWSPERNPEGFAVLQAAYADACARLEAGPAEAPAAPAAPVAAWTAAEWGAWMREAPRTLEGLREELARHPGEPAASVLAYATEGALAPETLRPRLVELLLTGDPGPHAYAAARIAFGLDQRLAFEGWGSLAAELSACRYTTPVDVARLDALVTANAVSEAWAHWQAVGPHLMASIPDVATHRYDELLGMAAWVVPEAEFEAQRGWLQDVHLELNDATRERLDRVVLVNLAVRRSAAEGSAHPNLVRAVQEAYGSCGHTRPEGVVAALWTLGESTPELARVLDTHASRHPMLVAACERLLLMVSGRIAFDEGRAINPGDWRELADDLKLVEAELGERVAKRSREGWKVLGERRARWNRQVKVWACIALFGAVATFAWPPMVGICIIGLAGLAITLSAPEPAVPKDPPLLDPTPADVERARARCFELQRQHGAWLHELALLAEQESLVHVGRAVDGCFHLRWHDLLALGPAHLRRARHPLGMVA